MRNVLLYGMATMWVSALPIRASSQCDRWQQRVVYDMRVELDPADHRFQGEAELSYSNNSPDTLHEVFFHLYFNAFRPGSEMDVRSRTIADPDQRVGGRIAELGPSEVGELTVTDMEQGGKSVGLRHLGTVLKCELPQALPPGRSTKLKYRFRGQVPVQIRRSGRNNAEGVAYSMAQWYPKLAEYDKRGWHAYPYVGREFYGVWGDFNVSIVLDSAFVIAATGELQNPEAIGHGYASKKPLKRPNGHKLTWMFSAKNVHDFAWAADKDFVHTSRRMTDGPVLHFFRKNDPAIQETWDQLPDYMERSFRYMNAHFGRYPWPQYSFVQGGDGGMEYPMLTLITGKRRLGSLVGVSVHESVHSWYYGVLASNEGRFPWMDEGFTEYASSEVMKELFPSDEDPHASAFEGYRSLVNSGKHEVPSLHADHFRTNAAYGATAYSFGEMFVHQLGAVIGEKVLDRALVRYYNTCKFKHPEPIDFERVLEKESGLELDWYFDEWINTTRRLDLAIREVVQVGDELRITLENRGDQLMPVDLAIRQRNGTEALYHVPLSLTRGERAADAENESYITLPAWQWTDPSYSIVVKGDLANTERISLDPKRRTADMDRSNDQVDLLEGTKGLVRP